MKQRVCVRRGGVVLTVALALVLLVLLYGPAATSDGSHRSPVGDVSGKSVAVSATQLPQSPGIAVCASGTIRDVQHLAAGQKQIAISGAPDDGMVHFAWWQNFNTPDPFQDWASVNCYDSDLGGFTLGDCGSILSYYSFETASYANLALMPGQDRTIVAYNELKGNGISTVYAEDELIPCGSLYQGGFAQSTSCYPHLASHHVGTQDVVHLVAWDGEWIDSTGQMLYWRRIGPNPASWSGPAMLDVEDGFNHHITASPVSGKVAITYVKEVAGVREVFVMESASNGDDWLAGSFTPYQITEYYTLPGREAGPECTGEYDDNDQLHVVYLEQVGGRSSKDCRFLHWRSAWGFQGIAAEAIGFPNTGSPGTRDLWLAYPQLGFGDGSTVCGGGTNDGYVYLTYIKYGGPTPAEANDISAGSFQNAEIYLTISTDDGNSWSHPANLTNTKTPGCTAGNCDSEREPSLAAIVNDTLHIMYVLDQDAGDADLGEGTWTLNPVMYLRIPGGADAEPICPTISPMPSMTLSDGDPNCPYYSGFTSPTEVYSVLSVYNLGNATLNGTLSINYLTPGAAWLSLITGGISVPPASPPAQRNVTLRGYAVPSPGIYQAEIRLDHNSSVIPSPILIPVEFFVFDEFDCGGSATPTGTNVDCHPLSRATITFASVTEAGFTGVAIESGGPTPPEGYDPVPLAGPAYWNVTTTAGYSGDISVCLTYSGADVQRLESALRLFHFEEVSPGNYEWVDVTTSLNTTTNTICGVVTTLSPFIIVEPSEGPPTVDIPASKDNNTYDSDPTWSNGAGDYINVDLHSWMGCTRRGLIAFDVAGNMPEGVIIDSAHLVLYNAWAACPDYPEPFSIHRVTSDWGAGISHAPDTERNSGAAATVSDATWSHAKYPSTPWGTSGGDFVGTASATVTLSAIGYYTWKGATMAADVQGWLDNPSSNYGWLIKGTESFSCRHRQFSSCTNANVAERPVLRVFYSAQTCDCPYASDLDANSFIDAVDLAMVIDIVFFGASDVQDPACPATRADFNSDGFADAVDLAFLIDHVFFGGGGPLDPCTP